MPFSIKTKIAFGISALFALLLAMSILALVFINLLSKKTENLLTANYDTIRYCSEMSEALNGVSKNEADMAKFEKNLEAQEHNITEVGEQEATQKLRDYFEALRHGNTSAELMQKINEQIYLVYQINKQALEKRNDQALATARSARLWLTLLTTLLVIVSFTLVLNLPGYIANPVRLLTEGIKEIAQKNYSKRIYLDNTDEFGEMATAFNIMAAKLYDYEHSNLSKLLFEKKRVETIINQMEDAVIGVDADNKILFINHRGELLFNLKEKDIVALYAPDVAVYNDLLRTVLQKKSNQPPLKIIVNGKESYFSVDYRSVYNEDTNIGEVITLKDITSFKELDISKTNLLATISHELKTPISSIKMSAKLINDQRIGSLNTEQEELLDNINEDAERLLRITGELLNMTQVESGNIQLKLKKTPPEAIVKTALKAVQMQADQKNVTIEANLATTLPDILADEDKTSWVLINLLTNAIKYSHPSGKIIVTVLPENGNVEFNIQDFGIGIEEKYLSRIFDRYFKVQDSTETSGTGIGLSISKEFIDAQNGTISVKSMPEKGSSFLFMLPVA